MPATAWRSLIKARENPPRDEEGTLDGVTAVVLTMAWGRGASPRGWTFGEQQVEPISMGVKAGQFINPDELPTRMPLRPAPIQALRPSMNGAVSTPCAAGARGAHVIRRRGACAPHATGGRVASPAPRRAPQPVREPLVDGLQVVERPVPRINQRPHHIDATSVRASSQARTCRTRASMGSRAAHFDHSAEPLALAAAPEADPMGLDGLFDNVVQEVIKAVGVRALTASGTPHAGIHPDAVSWESCAEAAWSRPEAPVT